MLKKWHVGVIVFVEGLICTIATCHIRQQGLGTNKLTPTLTELMEPGVSIILEMCCIWCLFIGICEVALKTILDPINLQKDGKNE